MRIRGTIAPCPLPAIPSPICAGSRSCSSGAHESTYRVRAFRGAAAALRGRDRDELAALAGPVSCAGCAGSGT